MKRQRPTDSALEIHQHFTSWHQHLCSRRDVLLTLTGGSVAAMFPWATLASSQAGKELEAERAWQILDAVQQHLLPTEEHAPGAVEINALEYLRFIVDDESIDADERRFIIMGTGWLEEVAKEQSQLSFVQLDETAREATLRHIEQSEAGENWLATVMVYLLEALMADPVYGGNTAGIGWRWLQHVPGYPRPPANKRYPDLLKI